jgi:hypothetical protein
MQPAGHTLPNNLCFFGAVYISITHLSWLPSPARSFPAGLYQPLFAAACMDYRPLDRRVCLEYHVNTAAFRYIYWTSGTPIGYSICCAADWTTYSADLQVCYEVGNSYDNEDETMALAVYASNWWTLGPTLDALFDVKGLIGGTDIFGKAGWSMIDFENVCNDPKWSHWIV